MSGRVPAGRLTWQDMQEENRIWALDNFPNAEPIDPVTGMAEETGELCHSVLKRKQGIRGTAAEHRANIEDAVGDVMIYALHFCTLTGLDLGKVFETKVEVPEGDSQRLALLAHAEAGAVSLAFLQAPHRDDLFLPMARLMSAILVLCEVEGFDSLQDITARVWSKVRQRNWRSWPFDADQAQ